MAVDIHSTEQASTSVYKRPEFVVLGDVPAMTTSGSRGKENGDHPDSEPGGGKKAAADHPATNMASPLSFC